MNLDQRRLQQDSKSAGVPVRPQPSTIIAPPSLQSRVGIVVLNYNGLPDTLECLASLEPVRGNGDVRIWVVDNDSAIDPRAAIGKAYPWCEVVRSDENQGWAGGNNIGIRMALKADCQWVMLLNNDTRVSPDIIGRLLAAVDSDPSVGVVGPLIHEWDPPERVQTAACFFNRPEHDGMLQSVAASDHRTDPPSTVDTDIVNGCCMMIRADVIRKIGEVDERFFLIHEESDFCLRVKQAGFACRVLSEGHVWHKHSVTFGRDPSPLQRYYSARNAWLLTRKHAKFPATRGRWSSFWLLLRHGWYMIDHDIQSGRPDAARAVIVGTLDAWTGRFGRRPERSRRFLSAVASLAIKALSWISSRRHNRLGGSPR